MVVLADGFGVDWAVSIFISCPNNTRKIHEGFEFLVRREILVDIGKWLELYTMFFVLGPVVVIIVIARVIFGYLGLRRLRDNSALSCMKNAVEIDMVVTLRMNRD